MNCNCEICSKIKKIDELFEIYGDGKDLGLLILCFDGIDISEYAGEGSKGTFIRSKGATDEKVIDYAITILQELKKEEVVLVDYTLALHKLFLLLGNKKVAALNPSIEVLSDWIHLKNLDINSKENYIKCINDIEQSILPNFPLTHLKMINYNLIELVDIMCAIVTLAIEGIDDLNFEKFIVTLKDN